MCFSNCKDFLEVFPNSSHRFLRSLSLSVLSLQPMVSPPKFLIGIKRSSSWKHQKHFNQQIREFGFKVLLTQEMFVCLLVCLFVCLFVCLLVCLFACLFVPALTFSCTSPHPSSSSEELREPKALPMICTTPNFWPRS